MLGFMLRVQSCRGTKSLPKRWRETRPGLRTVECDEKQNHVTVTNRAQFLGKVTRKQHKVAPFHSVFAAMAIGPNNKRPRKFSAPKHSATAKSSKLAKRRADFNASGYAKRQQRKASKKVGGGVEDVYDYRQDKVRRANVRLQLDKDEETGFGAGSDEDEDEDAEGGGSGGKKRPRLIGEIDDDERIASEDDEEIDSDAAFEESDEERFAGFDFGKRAKEKKVSFFVSICCSVSHLNLF